MKRQKHSPDFKAKVAFEAARELSTINEISSKYDIHPNMIRKWKQELIGGIDKVFINQNEHNKDKQHEKQVAQLYQKIGQLEVELDWLKKKYVAIQ